MNAINRQKHSINLQKWREHTNEHMQTQMSGNSKTFYSDEEHCWENIAHTPFGGIFEPFFRSFTSKKGYISVMNCAIKTPLSQLIHLTK